MLSFFYVFGVLFDLEKKFRLEEIYLQPLKFLSVNFGFYTNFFSADLKAKSFFQCHII